MAPSIRTLAALTITIALCAPATAGTACKEMLPHGEWKTASAIWWGHSNVAYGVYMPFEVELIAAPATMDPEFGIIYFDLDKYHIRDSELPALNTLAQWLRDNPAKRITIEGHCCDLASDAYNMRLGQNRADSVKRWLVEQGGIDGNRMATVSYGERRLVAGPPVRHLNRRVVTIIEQPGS